MPIADPPEEEAVVIIRQLRDLSRDDVSTAGGKGANLGELHRLGVQVPPGFVVTAQAYAAQARAWGLAERLRPHLDGRDWDAAAAAANELCLHGPLLPAIEQAVLTAHRELAAARVAVRSSATAEDLADASFAGQHETFLDIDGEAAVLDALRRCWASLWAPRALAYRAARGIDHLGVDIAVVVQQMVPAEFAGVLFTVDPVAQRTDRMLLEVAPGLGEAIVSGHVSGDVIHLGRAAGGELAIVHREQRAAGRPSPPDALVLALGLLGLRLEAHFGGPQDVEFAFAGGEVHLLQSRPITTLRAADVELEPIPPLPKLNRFQRRMLAANDNDRFPIAPRPLDRWAFALVMPAVAHGARHIGFAVDDAEVRAVTGALWTEVMLPPPLRPTLRLLGLPRRVAAVLRRDLSRWWETEMAPQILAACADTDVRALDDAALFVRVDHIADTASAVARKRFENMIGLVAIVAMQVPVTLAVGRKRAPAVMQDLVSGLRTRTSEVNEALYHLAREAAARGPEVTGPLRDGQPAALADSEAGRAFLAEVEAFLAEHGHRESSGLYLSAPMWRRDQAPMWAILRGMLDVAEPPSEQAGLRRYQAALAEVTGRLRRVPGLARWFERLVERVRGVIVYRERTHFDLARVFSALQDIFAEAARRLHDRGLLPAPDDVFYLTESEVRTWLLGQAPPRPEIEQLVRRRRATYAEVNRRWQRWNFAAKQDGATDELRGVGASSGVVRGVARIVRDEREFSRLGSGEILVCPYTNPAWTPLFTFAAGVVTNTGGAASHAAIVAREYGIPAVLGAAGATERIADGQEILVDGDAGRVTLIARPPHG